MAQPESKLSRAIMKALKEKYGKEIFVFKVHGGPLMMNGLPDLIGVVRGQAFALETKMPGNKPTERQLYVHALMRRAGCIVGVPYSVAEALSIIHAYIC